MSLNSGGVASVSVAGTDGINPACAIMTENCPEKTQCRLQVQQCWVECDGAAAQSCYHYSCVTCGKGWHVRFEQKQPVYDAAGRVVEAAQILVEEVSASAQQSP